MRPPRDNGGASSKARTDSIAKRGTHVNITGIPALTLADVRQRHPGWEVLPHGDREGVWAAKRGTTSSLRARNAEQAEWFIEAFEQAAA